MTSTIFQLTFSADIDLIAELQTSLVLPEDASVTVTTQIEMSVTIITDEGDESGTCESDGCKCKDGFTQNEDGSCSAPEPTMPTVEARVLKISALVYFIEI